MAARAAFDESEETAMGLKKRYAAILLTAALAVSMSACGAAEDSSSGQSASQTDAAAEQNETDTGADSSSADASADGCGGRWHAEHWREQYPDRLFHCRGEQRRGCRSLGQLFRCGRRGQGQDAEVIEDGFTVNERNVPDAAGDIADWLDGLGY